MYWRGPIGTGILADDPYQLLGVPRDCKDVEIKKAYQKLAMQHHPDKGGDVDKFITLQRAYALISNPRQRAMHDGMREYEGNRTINNARSRPLTEEERSENVDYLKTSDVMKRNKTPVDPNSAVVLTCDLCGNVAFDVCYACNSNVCQYCVLRPHYTSDVGPHYGVRAHPEYGEKIARQEKVQKVQKELEAPKWHRSTEEREGELRTLKYCRKMCESGGKDQQIANAMLQWFYAWGQTENLIQLVVLLPVDHISEDKVRFSKEGDTFSLKIETNCGTVIVDRQLSFEADPDTPPDVVYAEHSPFFAAQIVKKNLGEHITEVFVGDTFGARCFDQKEHEVSSESREHQDDVEVNVQVPVGTNARHIQDVVMAHNNVSFRLDGWGSWNRHVQDYTYVNAERDRYVDWAGANWTMLEDGDGYSAVQFSLPRHHTRIGDKKEEKKHRRNPRPFFIEDDDPFKLYGMVEARMYGCVEDHYRKRALLSKDAEEHLKEFEKAKLNLLMIKSVPENEPEEVDSDDVSEERTIQLWKQPPIKPMEEWLADSRARLQEEWATNFAPNATQSARDAAKQERAAQKASEQAAAAAKVKKAKPKQELTRLQQKILEKQKQKKLDEANAPPLLFKRKVEVQEKWDTINGYSWEDAGKNVKISVSMDVIEDPDSVEVELKPEFDSFWLGIKTGSRNYCLQIENLSHDINEDVCTVKWRPSSKRAIITLRKDDTDERWGHLQKGSGHIGR